LSTLVLPVHRQNPPLPIFGVLEVRRIRFGGTVAAWFVGLQISPFVLWFVLRRLRGGAPCFPFSPPPPNPFPTSLRALDGHLLFSSPLIFGKGYRRTFLFIVMSNLPPIFLLTGLCVSPNPKFLFAPPRTRPCRRDDDFSFPFFLFPLLAFLNAQHFFLKTRIAFPGEPSSSLPCPPLPYTSSLGRLTSLMQRKHSPHCVVSFRRTRCLSR